MCLTSRLNRVNPQFFIGVDLKTWLWFQALLQICFVALSKSLQASDLFVFSVRWHEIALKREDCP